jgi:hypothetical protein
LSGTNLSEFSETVPLRTTTKRLADNSLTAKPNPCVRLILAQIAYRFGWLVSMTQANTHRLISAQWSLFLALAPSQIHQHLYLSGHSSDAPMRKRKRGKAKEANCRAIGPLIFFSLGAATLTACVAYHVSTPNRQVIPLSVFAVIIGLILESRKIAKNWSDVLNSVLFAFCLSLCAFIPFRKEYEYSFENHVAVFPYFFIGFLSILRIGEDEDAATPKLTEGITLVQSIALAYWIIDYDLVSTESLFLKISMFVGLLLSLYSVFHAFTRTTLSRAGRFTLSIWSSVVMLVFAAGNINRMDLVLCGEHAAGVRHIVSVALESFLLGVSCIYMIQNFLMLARFLPDKNRLFNAEYRKNVRELTELHIKRYSDSQVDVLHSLLCVIFSVSCFALNYHYQIAPRNVAIWGVFVVFPLVLAIWDRAVRRKC